MPIEMFPGQLPARAMLAKLLEEGDNLDQVVLIWRDKEGDWKSGWSKQQLGGVTFAAAVLHRDIMKAIGDD